MSDLAKVQAMRDANWTPAVEYWQQRAKEATEALEMAECRGFSAGYEAGERDGKAARDAQVAELVEALEAIERGDDSIDGMQGDIARAAFAKIAQEGKP